MTVADAQDEELSPGLLRLDVELAEFFFDEQIERADRNLAPPYQNLDFDDRSGRRRLPTAAAE